MTIYNIYIFDRSGTCIFYHEWKRDKIAGMIQSEEFKLMFGMLWSLRSLALKLSLKDGKQSVRCFETNLYKMTYFETPTGVKFVINTDLQATNMHEMLRQIYANVYVELVVKNPLIDAKQSICSELFRTTLDDLVQRHPNIS